MTPEDVAGDQTVTKRIVAEPVYEADDVDSIEPRNNTGGQVENKGLIYTLQGVTALATVDGQLAVRYFTQKDGVFVVPKDA